MEDVVSELSKDPSGNVRPEMVRAAVTHAFEDFASARIVDFVPILARRRARQTLRDWSDKRLADFVADAHGFAGDGA